jgi:hypothetical protein
MSDAKDEVLFMFGADLKVGDQLRRINLPPGWPQQTLTIISFHIENDEPILRVSVSPRTGAFDQMTILTKNIGVLYERVGSSGHEQTTANHPDPARTERGKR